MPDKSETSSMQSTEWCEISSYPWGGAYRPKALGRIQYYEENGFWITMRSFEKDPLISWKDPDSPVYEDSCMECFINVYPEKTLNYLNFEVNAAGVMLSQWGNGKEERIFLKDLGLMQPKVSILREPEFWEIEYCISKQLIHELYGNSHFQKEDRILYNFYKCGDRTAYPHFGCYAPILWEKPNFHLPQFFAQMKL